MEHAPFLKYDEGAFIFPTVLFGITTISIGVALAITTLLTSWKLTEEYQFFIHHQKPARFKTFLDLLHNDSLIDICSGQLCAVDIKTLRYRHPLYIAQSTTQLEELLCAPERFVPANFSGITHPNTCLETLQLSHSVQIKGNIITSHMRITASDDLTILVEGSVQSSLDIKAANTVYLLSAGDVLLKRIDTEIPVTLWILSATGSISIDTIDSRVSLFTSAKDTHIGSALSHAKIPEHNQFSLPKLLLRYGTQID